MSFLLTWVQLIKGDRDISDHPKVQPVLVLNALNWSVSSERLENLYLNLAYIFQGSAGHQHTYFLVFFFGKKLIWTAKLKKIKCSKKSVVSFETFHTAFSCSYGLKEASIN